MIEEDASICPAKTASETILPHPVIVFAVEAMFHFVNFHRPTGVFLCPEFANQMSVFQKKTAENWLRQGVLETQVGVVVKDSRPTAERHGALMIWE